MWVTWCTLLRGALRDRISLFWAILAPLALLFGLGTVFPDPDDRRRLILGLMALGTMSFSLSGTGFEVMRQRTRGVYKLLRATPFRIPGFVIALASARGLLTLASGVVVAAVGAVVYGLPGSWWTAVLAVPVLAAGAACFLPMGVLLGNLGNNENQVALYNNLFLLPQVFASEMFYSLGGAPEWVRVVSRLMPANHVVSALQAAAAGDGAALVSALAVLLVSAVCFLVLAVVTFRWDAGEPGLVARRRGGGPTPTTRWGAAAGR
ncbi:MAG TPA: ABC transporter permease [Limnochordales bacterium]